MTQVFCETIGWTAHPLGGSARSSPSNLGELLVWVAEPGISVRLGRAQPFELASLRTVAGTLNEWTRPADEETDLPWPRSAFSSFGCYVRLPKGPLARITGACAF